jgi:hypothetical protein
MLSRKDYEAIAAIVKRASETSIPTLGETVYENAWVSGAEDIQDEIVRGLVEYFRQDNPRFDPERFKAACRA